MKKLNLFTTCFLSLISFTLFGQWEIQNQIPDTISLRDVFFTNDSCGWAVGSNHVTLKTIDAGNSWMDASFTSGTYNVHTYYCIYFSDENHGWVAGESVIQGGGHWDIIYHTSNGGISWTNQYHEAGNAFREILFIDDQKGFATGYISLFHTVDGGENWEYDPIPASCISFPSDLKGWIGSNENIMYTDNGGINWVLQFNCQGMYNIYDIYFTNDNYGWAVGKNVNDETGIILKTINGGQTWSETGSFEDILSGVFFIDNYYGWVIGHNGRIIYTNDGGASWNDQSVEAGYLWKIFITDNYQGWITGENGLYHTDLSSIVGINNPYFETQWLNSISVYPNPLSNRATMEFSIEETHFVSISIVDITGKQVERLLSEVLLKGNHKIVWNAEGLKRGMYYIRFITNGGTKLKKIIKL